MRNKKLFAILTLVCFMFTLMPVAAFAANTDPETSVFEAVKGDQTVRLNTTGVNAGKTDVIDFELSLYDKGEVAATATTGNVYIWAVNESGVVSSAMEVAGADASGIANVYTIDPGTASKVDVDVQFVRAGVYTVKAALFLETGTADELSDLTLFSGDDFSVITVKGANVNPDGYVAEVYYDDATTTGVDISMTNPVGAGDFAEVTYAWDATDAEIDVTETPITLDVTPNNVMTDDITVTFYEGMTVANDATAAVTVGKALKKEVVTIETNSSAISVDKATATTNNQGEIEFAVSASVEGDYEVYLTVDGQTWTLNVSVGNTNATYIENTNAPKAPQALYGNLGEKVRFEITDINGNIVTSTTDGGLQKTLANVDGKYIVLTEKPADSTLESEDLDLIPSDSHATATVDAQNPGEWYLGANGGKLYLDAEGHYAVKVILDNGAYATAEWDVKKFDKPVKLRIDYRTKVVELGGSIDPSQIVYVDANGVEKKADDVDFAATGYAVAGLSASRATGVDSVIKVKTDERYVGEKINVTVVSEKYDLVATAELTVAEGASEIAFVDTTAEVDVNNKITWNVVDSNGTKVALDGSVTKTEISYVVLDKPEGAKVSVNDKTSNNDLKNKGEGKMALTSDTVGNVTVQVLLKATYPAVANQAAQVKYYTGVGVIPVGMEGTGDVVVMSIGSNEIIKNDTVGTLTAAPEITANRTFVPFRALAEAFGAEVAWDAATQSVTATLNGVTVVLTIGSETYTVNGVEMSTGEGAAPYIKGASTMVPVRFVADAFGIKVIPTYNQDGTTSDILFIM